MALTLTTTKDLTPTAGLGYCALVDVAYDTSYPTGGETIDLSGIFPNAVFGGCIVNDTLDDAGFRAVYVAAAAGAPATGVIQLYWGDYDAVADGALIEVANTTNVSAMTGQRWLFFGE